MADVVQLFTLLVPPGVNTSVLHSLDCPLGNSDVSQIDIVFPPGCAGLVGARIEFAHNPVYPIGAGNFFILDGERLSIPVSKQGTSGQWTFTAYNIDFYPHTLRAYFYFNFLGQPVISSSSLVSL